MRPEADAQVRIFGTVKKSDITLGEVCNIIAQKHPGDAGTIQDAGDMVELYEVCFDKAHVTVGMTEAQVITF